MSAVPAGFFQSEAVRTLLSRASRAAGVPIAVHFVMNGHEGPLVTGFGGCAACKHVAGISGGKAACRASRSSISAKVQRQARAIAETCHLGFGVLAVPALPDENYVLALGPFVPAGGDASLEHDAIQGLADITGELQESFPTPLDDIHRAPAGSFPATAEWVCEELARLWAAYPRNVGADDQELTPKDQTDRSDPTDPSDHPPLNTPAAQSLATAIAGGHRKRARALLKATADECIAAHRRGPSQVSIQLLTLLTQTLTTCAKAGIDTSAALALLPQAAAALPKLDNPNDAVDCALRVLRPLLSKHNGNTADTFAGYRPLDKLLAAHLPEGLRLSDAAAQLGKSPAAITLHLQRHFGLSYTEYQGRLRIERAKEYLRRTKLTVTQIATRVGIDDPSNFAKLFRRHTAASPLEYRARHTKKKSPPRKKEA